MNFADRFSSENLLMSVCGHLFLVAIMITSFVVVVDRAKLVAPDRIEIMEIDLNSVKVSGDESILYNVNADKEPVPETKEEMQKEEKVAEPEKEIEPEPIETPSLVEEKKEEIKDSDSSKKEKVEEIKQEPKKKRTVVRVNREVVSLDRTLTISVVDALRVAMTRC